MEKANYSVIANFYDQAHSTPEQRVLTWLDRINDLVGKHGSVLFLDLGCGTGRFSIPAMQYLKYEVTGTDRSEAMLKQAKSKAGSEQVCWICADSSKLPFKVPHFDVVFMSHLLHHVDDPLSVLDECKRVLLPGGILINRYGAMEDIQNDPEHRFFPGVLEIDKERTPTKLVVNNWFHKTGLRNVFTKTFEDQTADSPKERLRRDREKATSVLSLISDENLQNGLGAFAAYIRDCPEDRTILFDKITLTSGIK